MKFLFGTLLVIFYSIEASAQKNFLFADIGIPGGFSVTYNYKFLEHMGVGIGLQGYDFSPSEASASKFVPAVFGDIRFYHPKRKHLFFYMIDIGMNFYKSDNFSTNYKIVSSSDNGVYVGLGLGYFRPMTKRGNGPYVSFKFISNGSTIDEYYYATGKHSTYFSLQGPLSLSIGFKF